MTLSQNVFFNDRSMLKLLFLFSKYPDFSGFSNLTLDHFRPKIPDRDTQLTPFKILISNQLLCIYHLVILYQVFFQI